MLKNLLLLVVGILSGMFVANSLHSNDFINGRLSACNDITSALNEAVGRQIMTCERVKNEVLMNFAGQRMTLDGKLVH